MKCLVTGGAGFIGSHLVERLLHEGHTVAALDNCSLGNMQNLASVATHPLLHAYLNKSITEDLKEVFTTEQPEIVFHVAALPRVQFSIKNPKETHEINVNGTVNLLQACKESGVKRFVFSSSSSIYGYQHSLPLTEAMAPNPLSPYALHKLIGEHYCTLFSKVYGLETISLRYFNVFGPRQSPAGDYACLIPRFIAKFKSGNAPAINGDGNQTRDFTYVKDVVEANLCAAFTQNQQAIGQAYNIGSGKNISVNNISAAIKLSLKSIVTPTHREAVLEPRNTLADTTKAKELLAWQPRYTFEQALQETLAIVAD